jgi:hypothetical protein
MVPGYLSLKLEDERWMHEKKHLTDENEKEVIWFNTRLL